MNCRNGFSFAFRAGHGALCAVLILAAAVSACHSSEHKSPESPVPIKPDTTGKNVFSVSVNGVHCDKSVAPAANQLCGTVTVCEHGTANCQTINNIIIDTGSSGFRVFASVLGRLHLAPVASGQGTLAECIQFADGSSEWGTVVSADIKLADEPAVVVPIHLIDAHYATPPKLCSRAQSSPDESPDQAGFNGILGLGLFRSDCGADCENDAQNESYFSCAGQTCTPVATSVQVQNPVALLPNDNNGIIIKLPAVSAQGAPSLEGTLLFGIGTQANNMPSQAIAYATDEAGNFKTVFSSFKATAITGFIDSGSTVLCLPAVSSLPLCTVAGENDYFCPSRPQTFSATNVAVGGAPSGVVSFTIASARELLASGANSVFCNLAQSSGAGENAEFDWGLPFFFGRTVYVGLEGTSSPLGSGTYWAY